MKKGLIISGDTEKYEKEIRNKLHTEYLLHFSCDMNLLSAAIISGDVAFIAFDPKTLFNFINEICFEYRDRFSVSYFYSSEVSN